MADALPTVGSVNISEEKGTVKHPVDSVEVDRNGIVGDAHAGPWHRQVSLLPQMSIDRFCQEHQRPTTPGEFAENITVESMSFDDVRLLDKFDFSGGIALEVTQIGKKCHGDGCAIFRQVGQCVMPREGLFTRVLAPGAVKPGDTVQHDPHTLRCQILTLSDRASRGDYEDRSGPAVAAALQDSLPEQQWRTAIDITILPDNYSLLQQNIQKAIDARCAILITTGGTGIGPCDITPEVIQPMLDKQLPGIMDHIRLKYGATKPAALISRSIAGVIGSTLVFALPGSVRAVEEYMNEIGPLLPHLLFMVNGIDRH